MAKKEEKKNTFPEKIEENAEEIATAVSKISRGMEVLSQSRMKRKTILLLLAHSSGCAQRDVDKVLQALTDLEKTYLK